MKYNDDVKKGLPSAQPSLDGLYTALGNQADVSQAKNITPRASAAACHCNDLNSDPLALGYQPPCATYIASFNHAYFPDQGPQLDVSGAQLTAGEWAKMQLWDHHPNSGWLLLPQKTTGTRLYPPPPNCPMLGQEAPYCGSSTVTLLYDTPVQSALGYSNPNVPGQVTKDGTLVELMAQINPLGAVELGRFVDNRIRQIKPTASDAEIIAVLSTKLKLRSKYYLYMNQTSGNLVMDTQAPPWLDPNFGTVADGKPKIFPGIPFNLVPTLINPHHDFNIHDEPFLDWSLYPPDPNFDKTSLALDSLTGTFTPASGAYNLLGTISFEEKIRNVGLPTVFYNPN